MGISVFEHPALCAIFDASRVAPYFSLTAEIDAILRFEHALAQASADVGLISKASFEEIARVLENFQPNLGALNARLAQDGVIVPGLVVQIKSQLSEDAKSQFHFGATSQDAIDSGLMIRLTGVLGELIGQLQLVVSKLDEIDEGIGHQKIFARTRMQQALPSTLHQRIALWRTPLKKIIQSAEQMLVDKLPLSLSGAVGDRRQFDDFSQEIVVKTAQLLGLRAVETWHTQREPIVAIGQLMAHITSACGKIGTDLGLMSQNEVKEITFHASGSSSAMPHKNNPVRAEILTSLSQYNAVQTGALNLAALHEQERSGAAWSLEWMVLPQMIAAASAALENTQVLLSLIDQNAE
jgi:3-carboxy-cis,cis-muconate cycloisomerase